jgi:hypothetical protein
MSDTLTVILGAGSSYDCVSESTSDFDTDYRPPLAKELFALRRTFNEILHKYKGAETLSDEIRNRVNNRENMEDVLKDLYGRPSLPHIKQFLEVPLYIQELLGEVGRRFIRSGVTKFHTLVNALEGSRFQRVMFLTLNYDLLLEDSLSRIGMTFPSLSTYCRPENRWSLIKAHGSVIWGRRWTSPEANGPRTAKLISGLTARPTFSNEIVLLKGYKETDRMVDGSLHYPALAVPMGETKEFVCPQDHVQFAEDVLGECSNFLVIGFSALDKDVLSLLRGVQGVGRLCIVNENPDAARQTLRRIVDTNGKFHIAPRDGVSNLSTSGFASFVDHDLARFLRD